MSIKKGMPKGFLGTHDGLPSDDLLESINAVTGKLDEKNSMNTDDDEGCDKDKKKKTLVDKAASALKTFDKGFKVAKEDVDVDETVDTVEEETDTLVSEEFGEGVILSVNEDTVEIMFEHGIETVSFEQLDELSKDTLKTYVTKANDDITNKAKDFLKKDSTKDSRKAATDAISKRNKGIRQARSKMTEEAEQIDELSKATLGSYVKKATKDVTNKTVTAHELKNGYDKKYQNISNTRYSINSLKNKADQRTSNIHKAVDKITDKGKPSDKKEGEKIRKNISKLHKNAAKTGANNAEKAYHKWEYEYSMNGYDLPHAASDKAKELNASLKRKISSHKLANNVKNVNKSVDKLTKEEVETIAEDNSSLGKVRKKLEDLHYKEVIAAQENVKKHHAKLHAKFHKEAPAILAKHGFKKASEGDNSKTFVKGHADGHVTTASLFKHAGVYDPSRYHMHNSKTGETVSHHIHDYVNTATADSDAKREHLYMIPNFEANVIKTLKNHENGTSHDHDRAY